MEYNFSAERKLVFIVSVAGRNLLVEFGDRNSGGRSSFTTTDGKVAQAIRRTSLARRGVIVETTPTVDIPPASSNHPSSPKIPTSPNNPDSPSSSREYDNFTLAREAIIKEFGIKKSEVRNPTALARFALSKGIIIKYKNAEQ